MLVSFPFVSDVIVAVWNNYVDETPHTYTHTHIQKHIHRQTLLSFLIVVQYQPYIILTHISVLSNQGQVALSVIGYLII